MEMLPKTAERIFVERILTQALRVIKISNQFAFAKLDQSDFDDLADGYVKEFMSDDPNRGEKILEEALSDFKLYAMRESNINLGSFNAICYSIKSRLSEHDRTNKIIGKEARHDRKAVAQKYISEIRENLKKAIKPLPYDKSWRVK